MRMLDAVVLFEANSVLDSQTKEACAPQSAHSLSDSASLAATAAPPPTLKPTWPGVDGLANELQLLPGVERSRDGVR